MGKIIEQKSELLTKNFSHLGSQTRIVFIGALRKADFHLRFLAFFFAFPALLSRAEIASVADV